MNNDDSIQYLMDRPDPSDLFLEARQLAGMQLQEQFNRFNQFAPPSPLPAFHWVKAELTYPAFDHLSFAHKNAIFSVVIEVWDGSESSFTEQQQERLLDACRANQLIPCVFRLDYEDELEPATDGWNLVHASTGERIDPSSFAEEGPVVMSAWELTNFAIQVVRDDLEKQGNEVLSFCDLPEVNPQIWFRDSSGNACWALVQCSTSKEPLTSQRWQGFEQTNDALKPFAGYFAGVRVQSTNAVPMRGDGMMVDYRGIEKIYDGQD
jgi:hypothetical protein